MQHFAEAEHEVVEQAMHSPVAAIEWAVFGVLLVSALIVDFKYGGGSREKSDEARSKSSQQKSFQVALWWTLVWVLLSLFFGAGVYVYKGQEQMMLFMCSYLLRAP